MIEQVIKTPFLFGWAKNRNEYRLKVNNVASVGSVASFSFTFASLLPAVGGQVVFTLDGREIAFKRVGTTPSNDYEFRTLAQLAACIQNNPYLATLFNYSYVSSSRKLTLTATSVGYHSLTIHTLSADGLPDGYEAQMITASTAVNGADKTYLPNYGIMAQLEVVANSSNSLLPYTTENMVFHADSEGYVDIPLDILRGYIPQPDLPTSGQWQLLTNALLKYRLHYGEMYGEGTPMVQRMTADGYRYALCGEVAERFAALNLPDWNSGQSAPLAVGNNNIFWIIGEDTGLTVDVRDGQPVWLYGLWYDTTKAVGATLSVNVYVFVNGSRISLTTQSVKNGYIYRILSDGNTLGVPSGTHQYEVHIRTSAGTWTRNYRVQSCLGEQRTMLLQNKYGLLQPFVVGSLKREITTEGDELTVERRRYIDTTDHYELYTALTPKLSRWEAARMARCLGGEYHYIQDGSSWLRITIEPNTFAVRDDAQGLVQVEFGFRFVENQLENLASGSTAIGLTLDNVSDNMQQTVSFENGTIPGRNEIWS